MGIGVTIKKLRIEKNQSLQDVADAVSASKAHIWEIEKGNSKNPSIELLTKLAVHFGVTISHLVGEEPSTSDEPELVAMYRDLKELSEGDRETIKMLMARFQEQKRAGEK